MSSIHSRTSRGQMLKLGDLVRYRKFSKDVEIDIHAAAHRWSVKIMCQDERRRHFR